MGGAPDRAAAKDIYPANRGIDPVVAEAPLVLVFGWSEASPEAGDAGYAHHVSMIEMISQRSSK